MKRLFLSLILLAIATSFSLCLKNDNVNALSGSEFQAGRIIDDGVFFNGYGMNTQQIQTFLNAKVPVCDTWHQRSTNPRDTGPPYTCLKDYSQVIGNIPADAYCNGLSAGTKTAAQIIYEVGASCGISQKVILVTLQKEQSFISDTWPRNIEYEKATGYGCPDTPLPASVDANQNGCYDETEGFFNQIYYGARQFKRYAQDTSIFTSYRPYRNNCIKYHPSSNTQNGCVPPQAGNCGASTVYIQNQATSGLYVYTPYQPNPSALNSLYGSGDSCGAYGNRNFWVMFNDWFGTTHGISSGYFAVFNDPDGSGRWYLAVQGAKHYIPSELYNAWGLNRYPVQNVPKEFFDSFPTYNDIGRIAKDEYQNYFFIDGGSAHYISNQNLLSIWNLDRNLAVQSTGLIASLANGGTWTGRFMKTQSNSNIYVMDGGKKRLVPSNSSLLYQWGYTPDQLTVVSDAYLNSLSDGGPVTQRVSTSGRNFIIDSGRVLYFDNASTDHAYAQVPTSNVGLMTLSLFPIEKGSHFTVGTTNPSWYMLEGGNRHYITDIEAAKAWGYNPGQPLTRLSDPLVASFTNGGNLSYVVQQTVSSGGSLLWAVDGAKHYMPSQAVADAWIASGTTPLVYSQQSLELLPRGEDSSTLIQANGSPFVYTLDDGKKRYLPLDIVVNAWGNPKLGGVTKLDARIVGSRPEAAPISVTVQNSGNNYLLVDGTVYLIDPAYASSWRVGASTPQIADSTLARFTQSPNTLKAYIKVGNSYYIMNDLYAIPVSKHLAAYEINNSNSVTLPVNYFSTQAEASYIVKSNDNNDPRLWLINKGTKTLLSLAQAYNYGYVSQGINATALSLATINGIADSNTTASLLVTKPGAGVKLLSFGYALGFPDGNTLTNYISSTNPILDLTPSIYDQFSLKKSASLLVRDDSGNIYRIDGGSKRLIQNQSTIGSTYPNVPVVYLESTAIVSIPTGSPL